LRAPERYLLSLAVTYAVTTFALAFYGLTGLDVYISIFIVEYFILTLLHSSHNSKMQKNTNRIGYALFGVFFGIIVLKLIEILGGANLL
jgi:hypothetical protein